MLQVRRERNVQAIFSMTGEQRMELLGFIKAQALPEDERVILERGTVVQLIPVLAKYYDLYLKRKDCG